MSDDIAERLAAGERPEHMGLPDKLRVIAHWFDEADRITGSHGDQVQRAVRAAADEIERLRKELNRKKYWLAEVAKQADDITLDAETGLADQFTPDNQGPIWRMSEPDPGGTDD